VRGRRESAEKAELDLLEILEAVEAHELDAANEPQNTVTAAVFSGEM